MGYGGIIFLGVAIVFIASMLFVVKQQTAAIVERLGKFNSIKSAGLNFKFPVLDKVVYRMNLRIQQLDVLVETKTKDNVFVKMKISVQFQVLASSVYDAFYRLQNPHGQITAYIFDVVRAEVPKMKLDDVFERKDDIAIAIKGELQEAMKSYGYDIVKALVTDIDPNEEVKHAMNRINAAEREKLAAEYEAEADKIKIVAKAKAEAESKKLQGEGIANQRREIARGLEDSVKMLNGVNINALEASALIVVTQHYDTLNSIGSNAKSNLILLPNSPNSANDLLANTISSFVAAQQMTSKSGE
jgi:regulator of protease activity HflC (stomatin/prohibitin superfamily)